MKTTRTLNQLMKAARKNKKHYPMGRYNGKRMAKHRIAAEKALGHTLPLEAVVHHIDLNYKNYANSNLVICPNKEYHDLLHERTKLYYDMQLYIVLSHD